MTLSFDQNGVQTNTFEEIFQRLDDGYKSIYGPDIDTDQESPDGQRISLEATARFDIESALAWLYSQLDPDLNNGDFQQVIGKLAGVYLLPASRSSWDLEVEMDRSSTLPSGYTIVDNNNQQWFLDSDVIVSPGVNSVTFLSVLWGSVSGISAGASFTQATPELGVVSISALADATIGRDEETEEQFRVRRKRSVENPAQSTAGAIYAKLAQLPGVIDVAVHENASSTPDVITFSTSQTAKDSGEPVSIEIHTVWVIIEGGELDDIGEVMVKQNLGNSKGDVTVSFTDTLIKPNGDEFKVITENKIDRPDDIPLYINLTATKTTPTAIVDEDAIKEKLSQTIFFIAESQQAAQLYERAYIDNFNYVLSDLEISLNNVDFTDEDLFPGYKGKFSLDVANITVNVV